MTDESSRLLTVSQVVEILQLSPATVYRLLARGELVSVKIGRSLRIPARCLDAFVNARIDETTTSLPQPMYVPPKRSRKGATRA